MHFVCTNIISTCHNVNPTHKTRHLLILDLRDEGDKKFKTRNDVKFNFKNYLKAFKSAATYGTPQKPDLTVFAMLVITAQNPKYDIIQHIDTQLQERMRNHERPIWITFNLGENIIGRFTKFYTQTQAQKSIFRLNQKFDDDHMNKIKMKIVQHLTKHTKCPAINQHLLQLTKSMPIESDAWGIRTLLITAIEVFVSFSIKS